MRKDNKDNFTRKPKLTKIFVVRIIHKLRQSITFIHSWFSESLST